MNPRLSIIAGLGMSLLATPALANSSLSITLSAHVDAFCHIYPPVQDSLTVTNGAATIGQVREICNTPDGYDVTAQFSNVSSGRLLVDGSAYQLQDGFARRSNMQPAVRNMFWQLDNTKLTTANAPVLMVVTITPR